MILKLLGLGTGFNPVVLAIVAVVIFGAGATSGWTVNGWRLGGDIATLQGEVKNLKQINATFENANKQCAVDVAATKSALADFYQEQKKLGKAVAAAIAKAAPQAAEYLRRAEEILSRSPVPPAEWCATIQKEQGEYVTFRRDERLKSMEKR